MQILYTGADAFNRPQMVSDKSLGGWVSNSPVPSGRMSNIFSAESYNIYQKGGFETKAIVIVNDTDTPITNLKFGYIYSPGYTTLFKVEVAFVTLQAPNFQKMELIASTRDTPYIGNFIEANIDVPNNIDNSASLGTLAAGAKLGIWLRRELLAQPISPCSASQPLPATNTKEGSVKFKIIWD